MPSKTTLRRARQKARQGKKPTTQAGEFVREEMEHAKRGKHPVKNRKQAIAIGLSKARRSGINIPAKGKSAKKSSSKRRSRTSSLSRGRARPTHSRSRTRARAKTKRRSKR